MQRKRVERCGFHLFSSHLSSFSNTQTPVAATGISKTVDATFLAATVTQMKDIATKCSTSRPVLIHFYTALRQKEPLLRNSAQPESLIGEGKGL